jgi:preprotein translocase subunit SecD
MAARQRNLTRFLSRSFLWAGLACGVILLISMFAFQRDRLTHQLRYRLEPHRGAVTTERLRRAASTLRSRFEALEETFGLDDAGVSLGPDNALHVEFSTRANIEEVLFWLTSPAQVRLSLLHPDTPTLDYEPQEDPPEGYAVRTYTRYMYRLSRPGDLKTKKHYYLVGEQPVMSVSRFQNVEFHKVGIHQRTQLIFRFTTTEGQEFRNITALNMGRQMVMLIDDRLFFPPKEIGSTVEGGAVQVQGYFYNPPLRKLVKVLNTGPLPGKLVQVSHEVE